MFWHLVERLQKGADLDKTERNQRASQSKPRRVNAEQKGNLWFLVWLFSSLTEQHSSSSDLAGAKAFMDLLQMKMSYTAFFPMLFWFDSEPTILPSPERE